MKTHGIIPIMKMLDVEAYTLLCLISQLAGTRLKGMELTYETKDK